MKNAAVLSLLLVACASGSMTKSNDADAYIRSAADRFRTAFNAGNAEAVTAFYADDAALLAPNAPIARGTSAIRQVYTAFLAAHPRLEFSPDRIAQSGDMAYEVGHYTLMAGNNRDEGNYVAVWRHQPGGGWKMVADSIVSSIPMAR